MRTDKTELRDVSVVRAAVYARFSSEMQSSTSARDQIERIRSLAEKDQLPSRLYSNRRIEIIPEWIQKDEAISGRIAGRAGYQRIQDGIRGKAFDLLIVDDLSRLTRSLGNLLDLYQLLRHHDIELISISDRVSSADPNARTFFTVKGMVADFGNEAHSERTLRGLGARARDGFSAGPKPYGYGSEATRTEHRKSKEVKSHFKIFIREDQAQVVRRIFSLYAEGFGRAHIATLLNREKVPHVKVGWNTGPLFRILTNEKYIGRWVYMKHSYSIDPDSQKRVTKTRNREEWITQIREDLRIVPQDLWDKVQARIKESGEIRKRNPAKSYKGIFANRHRIDNMHLLTGVMKCSECGSAYVIVSGKKPGYYGCMAAFRQGLCKNRALVKRDRVEGAVLKALEEKIVSNPQVIQYATDRYNQLAKQYLREAPSRRRELEKDLKKLAGEIDNLIRFLAEGKASQAVTEALQERETGKMRVLDELSRLSVAEAPRLLVTPYRVQKRLSEVVQSISERGDRYNGILREIFEGPLVLNKTETDITLAGSIDLGRVLGSTHCLNVLPPGFEPGFVP